MEHLVEHVEDPQTEGAEAEGAEEACSMARAAAMKASVICSSGVFSLRVNGVDVVAGGGAAGADVGCVEVGLPRDRVGHVAPTVFRRATDALMKEASSPLPHQVVGSAFRKHCVSFGICGKMPSQRSRSF